MIEEVAFFAGYMTEASFVGCAEVVSGFCYIWLRQWDWILQDIIEAGFYFIWLRQNFARYNWGTFCKIWLRYSFARYDRQDWGKMLQSMIGRILQDISNKFLQDMMDKILQDILLRHGFARYDGQGFTIYDWGRILWGKISCFLAFSAVHVGLGEWIAYSL